MKVNPCYGDYRTPPTTTACADRGARLVVADLRRRALKRREEPWASYSKPSSARALHRATRARRRWRASSGPAGGGRAALARGPRPASSAPAARAGLHTQVRDCSARASISPTSARTDIRFFVGYVAPPPPASRARRIYPRIFYKDVSLVWRAASHFVRSDARELDRQGRRALGGRRAGTRLLTSSESTTDLPFEMQTAFETC